MGLLVEPATGNKSQAAVIWQADHEHEERARGTRTLVANAEGIWTKSKGRVGSLRCYAGAPRLTSPAPYRLRATLPASLGQHEVSTCLLRTGFSFRRRHSTSTSSPPAPVRRSFSPTQRFSCAKTYRRGFCDGKKGGSSSSGGDRSQQRNDGHSFRHFRHFLRTTASIRRLFGPFQNGGKRF